MGDRGPPTLLAKGQLTGPNRRRETRASQGERPNGPPGKKPASSSVGVGSSPTKEPSALNPGRLQKGEEVWDAPRHDQRSAESKHGNRGEEGCPWTPTQEEGLPRRRKGSTEPKNVLRPEAGQQATKCNEP